MSLHPDILWKEIAFAGRGLRRDPLFTASSITLLALGIGLASAVFALLWQALYAQLPVPAAEQIYTFSTNVTHYGRSESDAMAETFSAPAYRYLATQFKASSGVIARHGEMLNLQTPAGLQHALADFVSGNFFDVLGVRAAFGRVIHAADDKPSNSGPSVAIISYELWQEAYGGEPSVWRRNIRVNGVDFSIAGIAPPGFKGLIAGQAPEVYLPLSAYGALNPGWHSDRDWAVRWLNAFVRLPKNLSRVTAEAELHPIYRAAVRQELASEGAQSEEYLNELAHERLSLTPAAQGAHAVLDQWGEPLRIVQWMTLAILALAAINVAGLMLVRAMRRKQEVLIRYAVGASRSVIIRLHLVETLMLSLAGGALGLFIARWGAQILASLARLDRGGALSYQPQAWVMTAHWFVAVLTGLLVGLLPAGQTAKLDVSAGLNEAGSAHSATRPQRITRQILAGAQIALSLVLGITASFFGEALHKLVSVPVGFDPTHLTVFSIDPKLAHSTVPGTELLLASIARELQAAPGVQSVSYGTGGPFPQDADATVVIPQGRDARSAHASGIRSIIGPRYFGTLGIRVISGREFDERDRANAPDVAMINETMARKLFGDANPLGQTVALFNGIDPNWLATVIGVVADHRQSWRKTNAALIYTPAQQARRITDIAYYVRTNLAVLREQTILKIVNAQAPSITAYDVAPMQSRMAEFASGERAITLLASAFALLALAIAAVGIYGVVAYDASVRTFEFGIRASFGATPLDILRLILREVILILTVGIVLGLPLTYACLKIVRHQLTGVSLDQPVIYGGALLLLVLCTLTAAFVPARRATGMGVVEALRHR